MASTSPSSVPATTSSSAWSRLVQITRVASNNSPSHPAEPTKPSAQLSSTAPLTTSLVRPAKRRRVTESPPPRCATDDSSAPASPRRRAHVPRTRCNDLRMFYPSVGHADCTTACPCQVEDVECVAPAQHELETEARQAKAPRFDRRKLVGKSHRDDGYGSPTRKTREDTPGLQLEEASLDPHGQSPKPQALDSPTKSCDSISEAEIGEDQDIPGSQPHRSIITSSSQAQQMQERSIHEIGAIFAPRKKPLSPNLDRPRHPKLSRNRSALSVSHEGHGKSEDSSLKQAERQQAQTDPEGSDRPLMTPTQPNRCGSPHAKGASMEADPVSETVNTCSAAALREVAGPSAVGLQDGDQNSINTTPKSNRRSIRSTARSNVNQLITPSTSPASKTEPQSDEGMDEGSGSSGPALMTKAKRRLNLHSSSYSGQPSQKKRKTPPKKQVAVQTTLSLNIGAGAGMKECKVCDTVYNPFHPEDVKVHAKRHAVVLKNGVRV